MRSLFLLIVPSVLAAQAAADTAPRPIALDEAVKLAQKNAPQTVQARGGLRSSAAQTRFARAAFFPDLTFNFSSSQNSGDRFDNQGKIVPFTGSPWQYTPRLSTNLQLFDGGRRIYNLRAANANEDVAESNDVLQRYNVALSVKQQYYAVLAARESETAARTQLEQAQQQLRASSAKVAAGAATKSDSLRQVIQVGNARLAMLTAENNLHIANATLTRLVATPFTVTAQVESVGSSSVSVDSAQLANFAVHGPSVAQAEASFSSARAAEKAAKTPYWPTINTTFSRSGSGSDQNFNFGAVGYAYSNNLSFSLNFPLWNSYQREQAVVVAKVATDNAEATLRDARLLALQNLVSFLSSLRSAEQRVSIQEATVAAAEEDLRVQQQRYNLGASTTLDVITSQTTLSQAQAALIQARFDARVAKAQIEALVGKDLQ
jgi:outer membrane protein